MKIAFIVNIFPSVSQTFVLNQITGLLDRGHDVDILSRYSKVETPFHDDVAKYGLLEKTHYIRFPESINERIVSGVRVIMRHIFKRPQTVAGCLNPFRHGRKALSLRILHQMAPFLKGYDIVHCQFGNCGNYGAGLKHLGLKAKLVTTFHGFDIRRGIQQGGQIYRKLFKQGDCFLSISPYNREHLIAFGLDSRKIVHHPVGIKFSQFPFRWREDLPADHPSVRIVTVARLEHEKGLHHGIRAVKRVLEQRPELNLHYTIVGDGELKPYLSDLISNLKLNEIVHLAGSAKQDGVRRALQENDIFLLPSVAEALPVVLMEAQASGLPCLASRVGSVDQLVLDGKSGYLVTPGDEVALGDKLLELIEHPPMWAYFGAAGRKHIQENYDVDRLNDHLVSLYERLIRA